MNTATSPHEAAMRKASHKVGALIVSLVVIAGVVTTVIVLALTNSPAVPIAAGSTSPHETPSPSADALVLVEYTLTAPPDAALTPDGVAGLLDSRLRGTGAMVTSHPESVSVGFLEPPSDALIASLTAPVSVEFRRVIVALDPLPFDEDIAGEYESEHLTDAVWRLAGGMDCYDRSTVAASASGLDSPPGASDVVVACDLKYFDKLVLAAAEFNQDEISVATTGYDGRLPSVIMELTATGGAALDAMAARAYALSGDQNRIAIFAEGALLSAPHVQEPSFGGRMIIVSNWTTTESEFFAASLGYGVSEVWTLTGPN